MEEDRNVPLDFAWIHEHIGMAGLMLFLEAAGTQSLYDVNAKFQGVLQRDIYDACLSYMKEHQLISPEFPDFEHMLLQFIQYEHTGKIIK